MYLRTKHIAADCVIGARALVILFGVACLVACSADGATEGPKRKIVESEIIQGNLGSKPAAIKVPARRTSEAEVPQSEKSTTETDSPAEKHSAAKYRYDQPPSIPDLASGKVAPPNPEDAEEELGEAAGNWFYGNGVGQSVATVSTVVAFPPTIIYFLGNAVLNLAGYDSVYVSDALPDEERKSFNAFYDDVTSVPGRVNAAVADRDFYDPNQKPKAELPTRSMKTGGQTR